MTSRAGQSSHHHDADNTNFRSVDTSAIEVDDSDEIDTREMASRGMREHVNQDNLHDSEFRNMLGLSFYPSQYFNQEEHAIRFAAFEVSDDEGNESEHSSLTPPSISSHSLSSQPSWLGTQHNPEQHKDTQQHDGEKRKHRGMQASAQLRNDHRQQKHQEQHREKFYTATIRQEKERMQSRKKNFFEKNQSDLLDQEQNLTIIRKVSSESSDQVVHTSQASPMTSTPSQQSVATAPLVEQLDDSLQTSFSRGRLRREALTDGCSAPVYKKQPETHSQLTDNLLGARARRSSIISNSTPSGHSELMNQIESLDNLLSREVVFSPSKACPRTDEDDDLALELEDLARSEQLLRRELAIFGNEPEDETLLQRMNAINGVDDFDSDGECEVYNYLMTEEDDDDKFENIVETQDADDFEDAHLTALSQTAKLTACDEDNHDNQEYVIRPISNVSYQQDDGIDEIVSLTELPQQSFDSAGSASRSMGIFDESDTPNTLYRGLWNQVKSPKIVTLSNQASTPIEEVGNSQYRSNIATYLTSSSSSLLLNEGYGPPGRRSSPDNDSDRKLENETILPPSFHDVTSEKLAHTNGEAKRKNPYEMFLLSSAAASHGELNAPTTCDDGADICTTVAMNAVQPSKRRSLELLPDTIPSSYCNKSTPVSTPERASLLSAHVRRRRYSEPSYIKQNLGLELDRRSPGDESDAFESSTYSEWSRPASRIGFLHDDNFSLAEISSESTYNKILAAKLLEKESHARCKGVSLRSGYFDGASPKLLGYVGSPSDDGSNLCPNSNEDVSLHRRKTINSVPENTTIFDESVAMVENTLTIAPSTPLSLFATQSMMHHFGGVPDTEAAQRPSNFSVDSTSISESDLSDPELGMAMRQAILADNDDDDRLITAHPLISGAIRSGSIGDLVLSSPARGERRGDAIEADSDSSSSHVFVTTTSSGMSNLFYLSTSDVTDSNQEDKSVSISSSISMNSSNLQHELSEDLPVNPYFMTVAESPGRSEGHTGHPQRGDLSADDMSDQTSTSHSLGAVKIVTYSNESLTASVPSVDNADRRRVDPKNKIRVPIYVPVYRNRTPNGARSVWTTSSRCAVCCLIILVITGIVVFSVLKLKRDGSDEKQSNFAPLPVPSRAPIPQTLRTDVPTDLVISWLPTSLYPTSNPSHDLTSDSPSTGPTIVVDDALFTLLAAASTDGGKALRSFNLSIPQYQAYDWLSRNRYLSTYSDDQKLQRYALATLFYSTGGSDWLKSDLWLSNEDECTWYTSGRSRRSCGPQESTNKTLLSLDLNYNNLQGTIPAEIALLSNSLTSINIAGGPDRFLYGSLPTVVGALTRLTELSIHSNLLTGTIPTQIGFLSSLQDLSMSNNYFKGSLPMEIQSLTALARLGLQNNGIEGSIPTGIGRLTSLKLLTLGKNALKSVIPTEFGNMSSLEVLDLQYNYLKGAIVTELGQLTTLKSLNLGRNEFDGSIPSEFRLMTRLNNLDLSRNRITGTLPDFISPDSRLQALLLNDNILLSGTIPASFEYLGSMQTMDIHATNITGAMPDSVCKVFNTTKPSVFVDCENIVCKCCSYCCTPEGICRCQDSLASIGWMCF